MLGGMDAGVILPRGSDTAIGVRATARRRAVVAVRDASLRSSIRSLLVRIGMAVTAAATEEATLAACMAPVELVILDGGLDAPAGADGRAGLCRRVSALPGMRHVPVVALCMERDAFASVPGARLSLAAPLDASSLLRALAPVLSLDTHGQIELVRLIDQDRGLPMAGGPAGCAAQSL